MSLVGYVGKDNYDAPFGEREYGWRRRADKALMERARLAKAEMRRYGLSLFRERRAPDWVRSIIEEVSDSTGVCPSEMAADNRQVHVVRARNTAIYRIKERKPFLSTPQIGNWFGKDHTSILHSLASHAQITGADPLVGYDLEGARARNRIKAASRSQTNTINGGREWVDKRSGLATATAELKDAANRSELSQQ